MIYINIYDTMVLYIVPFVNCIFIKMVFAILNIIFVVYTYTYL